MNERRLSAFNWIVVMLFILLVVCETFSELEKEKPGAIVILVSLRILVLFGATFMIIFNFINCCAEEYRESVKKDLS